MKKEDLIKAIEEMSVLDLSELVKELEEKFGVSATPIMPVGSFSNSGSSDISSNNVESEKTSFDVILTSAGDKKIQVIKVVRELTGLGLKEAKDLVDAAPKAVKESVSKDQAEELKSKLVEAGAQVEVK